LFGKFSEHEFTWNVTGTGIISSWLRDGKIDVKHEESVALDFYMKIEAFSIMNYVEP